MPPLARGAQSALEDVTMVLWLLALALCFVLDVRNQERYDRCWPERYHELARPTAKHAYAPQVANGHSLDQTVWNTDFESGTAKLTEAGKAHLNAIMRQPCAHRTVYLAASRAPIDDANCADRYYVATPELDAPRKAAVLKHLADMNCVSSVVLLGPSENTIVLGPPGIDSPSRLDTDEKLFERIRQERLVGEKEPEQEKPEAATENTGKQNASDDAKPAAPSVPEVAEEKYVHKNDFRTPLVPPIKPGGPPPMCEDAPDEARILRAWPHLTRGIPPFFEEKRDNIQIVTELLVDKIDPPKHFPFIGKAQLHHCHWKISIYYDETIESNYPFPFRCTRPRVQVIYMDLDHLHVCA
jgi:hypothetical protein